MGSLITLTIHFINFYLIGNKAEVELRTVLLGDIFNEVKEVVIPKPSQILMKIEGLNTQSPYR